MLIGIAGRKGSGKTAVANELADRLNLYHTSFGEDLRYIACMLLDLSSGELEREKETPQAWLDGITPRYIMQTLGTEWGRNMIHPQIWTLRTMLRATRNRGLKAGVIISDVRFSNEAQAIRTRGGIVVGLSRETPHSHDAHISENALGANDVDVTVSNNGPLDFAVDDIVGLLVDRYGR